MFLVTVLGLKPNILLIVADDMAWGDIGAFGNPLVHTPCLDQLAQCGLRLTQHTSASAVCAPARAALFTGRYPHRTGAIDTLEARGLDRLHPRETTLAAALKPAGYRTALIGKWHNGALAPEYHPNNRGFDQFFGFQGGWIDYWQWQLDANGSMIACDGTYLTDRLTSEALDFIKRNQKEPFFLHLAYNAPHFPLQAPEEVVKKYLALGLNLGVSTIYAMNEIMDRGIGQILQLLDELKLEENTIVLFTSDNGPDLKGEGDWNLSRFNGPFSGHKCQVYEGGIRVPAILRWPHGLPGNQTNNQFFHFTDWFPTLLAAAERSCETLPLDGLNALPVLRGDDAPMPRRFWQWNRYRPVGYCNAAMRDGPWKLVRPPIAGPMQHTRADAELDYYIKYHPESFTQLDPTPLPTCDPPNELPAPLLFDLDHDPGEQRNLALEQPARAARMLAELESWFEEVENERRSICSCAS